MHEIVWTVLPHGVATSGRLTVGIHIAPRLRGTTGRLGEFPAWVHWPETLRGLTFHLAFDGGPSVPIPAPKVDDVPWARLFDDATPVKPWELRKLASRTILSFPARRLSGLLGELYGAVGAASPESLPPLVPPRGREQTSGGGGFQLPVQAAWANVASRLTPDVKRWQAFKNPKWLKRIASGELKPLTTKDAPRPDFHQVVAALARHPHLLPRFGLCWEVEIDAATVPGTGTVQLVVDGLAAIDAHAVRPKTRYTHEGGLFVATPGAGADVAEGMLQLQDAVRFGVDGVDVDGGLDKLVPFLETVLRMNSPDDPATARADGAPWGVETDGGLPALRGAGLQVYREERDRQLTARLERGEALLTTGPADLVLHAEDVVRGWRFDVWDDVSTRWHSLHRRDGWWRLPDAGLFEEVHDQEGFSEPGATTAPPELATGTDALHVHEAIARWDGWSLSAPRPGRVLRPVEEEGGGMKESLEPASNPAGEVFRLETSYRPRPRTLPRLRYGRLYRFRARTVDLVGYSLTLEQGRPAFATAAVPYLRYEPVASPTLVQRRPLSEGDALERLVIRSNHDVSAADWAATDEARLRALDHATDERHVAPPHTSFQAAELHGCFDGAGGVGQLPDLATSRAIAERENASISDLPEPVTETIDPRTRAKVARSGSTVRLTRPTPQDAKKYGEDVQILHEEAEIPVRWLPDPMGRRAAFRGLPGTTGTFHVPFELNWPDARAFRIVLGEGEPATRWDTTTRELHVSVPKGETVTVRYGSAFEDGDLRLFGVWPWIVNAWTARSLLRWDGLAALHAAAVAGDVWMLTPYRELHLVHALQQPLHAPTWCEPEATRDPDEREVVFGGHLAVHAASTSQVDLDARWSGMVDDPEDPAGPAARSGNARMTVPVPAGQGVVRLDGWPRPELAMPDTRHWKVTFTPVGTTRYREYFPRAITEDRARITREGPSVELHVPSSARPRPPEIAHIIPTFAWERERLPNANVSRRGGGGVRVWLERPWFTSGDDEHLAVVLSSDPTLPPDASALAACVTRWGHDPIWATKATLPPVPAREHFPLALPLAASPRLSELPDTEVDVAAHPVTWDAERGAWFCDIDVNMPVTEAGKPQGEAYSPFIRLALARFQPYSLADLELSPVVRADYVQLTPERVLIVRHLDLDAHGRPNLVMVALFGPRPPDTGGEPYAFDAAFSVQRLDPAAPDELGWHELPGVQEADVETAGRDAEAMALAGLRLPHRPAGERRRLVVAEYETHRVDAGTGTIRRLVYLETVEI